jgi:carbon-monoxide dehydrogenase medium subunit
MIPQKFEYAVPKSLDEALELVARGAKPLAGGMSLIPMMKLRLAAPDRLVDLSKLKELNYIRESGAELHIGAATTHYDLESSALLLRKCPLLAETAAAIGDLQVRNMGTIGGSVAHADPAADYPAALQALEAKIVVKSGSRERTIAAKDFFVDAFTTALGAGEIVREIIVPAEDTATGWFYAKVEQPASGFAIVGIAVRIKRNAGRIGFVRMGVTGIANCSYRPVPAEAALEGKLGSDTEIEAAAAQVVSGVEANSDLHASAEYRRHLATVHAARAIAGALSRCT